jgi:NAD-dependent deacetylase
VWFGEAVPKIEEAIELTEKADIFVIIGTSMNVYPAAGLLNYVPRSADIYLIDPNTVNVNSDRNIQVIREGASAGVRELMERLTSAQ